MIHRLISLKIRFIFKKNQEEELSLDLNYIVFNLSYSQEFFFNTEKQISYIFEKTHLLKITVWTTEPLCILDT